MIQDAIRRVLGGHTLSSTEMEGAFTEIMAGEATPAQIAGFVVALRMRGETSEEIAAAARVMRAKAISVKVDADVYCDTCGTGGDGAGTFNISTTAAFVVAGAGVVFGSDDLGYSTISNVAVYSDCGLLGGVFGPLPRS